MIRRCFPERMQKLRDRALCLWILHLAHDNLVMNTVAILSDHLDLCPGTVIENRNNPIRNLNADAEFGFSRLDSKHGAPSSSESMGNIPCACEELLVEGGHEDFGPVVEKLVREGDNGAGSIADYAFREGVGANSFSGRGSRAVEDDKFDGVLS